MVATASRSSRLEILLVAWRASARRSSAAPMPSPSSDLDALCAALVERDGDRARAGVEAVLEQLLQHRCRPLDHLAGGDLADEQLGQDANGAHAPSI
jgi:hypothetical protein